MSKKAIEAALRRKGLSCSTLGYTHQVTPGEVVGGWEIELDDHSEELVAAADPLFDEWEPDCFNSSEVLEWVASLPNCPAPTPQPDLISRLRARAQRQTCEDPMKLLWEAAIALEHEHSRNTETSSAGG